MAEISGALYCLPRTSTQASPLSALIILKGLISMSFLTASESIFRPIRRLMAKRVFSGLVTAWRFACWPTSRSPLSEKATIEGVVRVPSAFAITTGSPPSITATQEFVVPRSIPITLLMIRILLNRFGSFIVAMRPDCSFLVALFVCVYGLFLAGVICIVGRGLGHHNQRRAQ